MQEGVERRKQRGDSSRANGSEIITTAEDSEEETVSTALETALWEYTMALYYHGRTAQGAGDSGKRFRRHSGSLLKRLDLFLRHR